MKSLFGKLSAALVVVVAIGALAVPAISGQNINISLSSKNPAGAFIANTVDVLGDNIEARGILTALGASGVPSIIKTGASRIARINVLTASGVVTIYDAASTVGLGTASEVAVVPATVGSYEIDFPLTNGLVINPSSSVISISYQ